MFRLNCKHLKRIIHMGERKASENWSSATVSSFRRSKSGLSYLHNVGASNLQYVPLGAVLADSAERWPDRPAVISRHENKTLTYSELLEQSDKLAAALKGLGIQKGERLGIWLPNYSEWIVAMMAASRCGIISVAINHLYERYELEYALKKVGVKALIAPGSNYSTKHYKILTNVIPELVKSKPGTLDSQNLNKLKMVILVNDGDKSPGTISYEKLLESAGATEAIQISRELNLIRPDSPCNIQYTSGTTGSPKAAILSHNNIVNNSYFLGIRNEIAEKKICVQVPLFHVYGVVVSVSAALQHGATVVLPSAVYSPTANIEALLAEKCEVIHGTPTMHIDSVALATSKGITGLKIEIAVTGGATVTPKLVEDLRKTLNVARVKSIFGMTETTAVNFQSIPGEDPDRPLHYLGYLHEHHEARVVNEKDELVPFCQPGELHIRGYSVMLGYWDDEAKTKEILKQDRWLRTGDQVILNEDGYSQINGRLKDIIIRGGENILPKEIEDVLSSHPDVAECQVFAVSDDRLGEEVCAAVRLREGAQFNGDALSKHISNRLAKYKVPRLIKQIDTFPKTASGKVQKFKLRNMVEAGHL